MLLGFLSLNLSYMIIGRCHIKWIKVGPSRMKTDNGDEDIVL